MIKNSLGREIPEFVEGIGDLIPYQGVWEYIKKTQSKHLHARACYGIGKGIEKLLPDIKTALERCNIKDGMTLSFHHHFRAGDETLMQVIAAVNEMRIKDITVFSSSLTSSHDGLIKYIENGTVSRIFTSGLREKLGKFITDGKLKIPAVIRTHGGRARSIALGEVPIDIAFVAAPSSDILGNSNGIEGPSACGSLGYAMVDALYADKTVIVTDNIVDYPLHPASIPEWQVDFVVKVDRIGNPAKIATGSTRITKNPIDLAIAQSASDFIARTPYFMEGMSFQVGAGGASLAAAKFMKEAMKERNIKGSFGIGGITSYMVELLEEGYLNTLFDVQSFDAVVAKSIAKNPRHIEIPATYYSDPFTKNCVVNNLDIVILAALQVDADFNVNVMTSNTGVLMGASGGHPDTAAGAKLTIIVCPSFRARVPSIVDKVHTVITPGESVDVIVTERGIAINPQRSDLIEFMKKSKLPIRDIHEIKEDVEKLTDKPEEVEFEDRIVALVEYRDGTIIDTIKALKCD
ncbi:MAG: citrate lyase subunit alpha [Candidatus Coatesbacteria bacterium]|nr:citrate lyase subunit alpha [Candidatus Coatesbacteria bacterium]